MVVEIGVGVGVGVTVTMIVVSLAVGLEDEDTTGVEDTSVLLVVVMKLELGSRDDKLVSVVLAVDELGGVGLLTVELTVTEVSTTELETRDGTPAELGMVVNPEGELKKEGALDELGRVLLVVDEIVSSTLVDGVGVTMLELMMVLENELGMTRLEEGVGVGVDVGVRAAELEIASFW